jgi:hypothetical protein
MLRLIYRWFGRGSKVAGGWPDVAQWAKQSGWEFRGVRDNDGFVIEGNQGSQTWRLEWGPSQRSYFEGFELRFRAELPVPGELQALLLSRSLMASMEKSVFDQYIEGVQTRIDTDIPPEMRWLVMFPKLTGAELKTLRDSYAGVANHKGWMRNWLNEPLSQGLGQSEVALQAPLVMMVARARLTMRSPMKEPQVPKLDAWMKLCLLAHREGHRAALEDGVEPGGASTQPSLWAHSAAAPHSEPAGLPG